MKSISSKLEDQKILPLLWYNIKPLIVPQHIRVKHRELPIALYEWGCG